MGDKTILVVDDEPHIRCILKFKLQQAGLSVITASNGQDAYELACKHRPDLIITDYQMPGLNGLDFCMRLMMNPDTAAIPALLLTARGHKVTPSDLARTKIHSLIVKPFSPRELLAQIGELLDFSAAADGKRGADAGTAAA